MAFALMAIRKKRAQRIECGFALKKPWNGNYRSGHRRYDQDDTPGAKGEDSWRYVNEDCAKLPPKPTLDGETSYENIPQGLHDPKQPCWTDKECRRYAYWSVFAGSASHAYGNNAVMQMHKPDGFLYEGL